MSDQEPAQSPQKTPIRQPKAESRKPNSVPLRAPCGEFEATPQPSRKPTTIDPKPDSVAPWLPESTFAPAGNETISFVRNILLTNPLFPRFYADVVLHSAPNSNEAKILRPRYQKLVEKVNEKIQMANKTCTHIKVTGVRCGSPALYGEQFCYFHQHAHRGVRKPQQSRLHPIAILEDEESIQASLMEVINALMRNTIDIKRAELILRALHIAVKNARRARFDSNASRVVREVPEYSAPESTQAESAASVRVGTDTVRPDRVETGAFARQATRSEAKGSVPPSMPAHLGTAASAVQRSRSEAQGSDPVSYSGEEDELPAVAASTYKPVHADDPEFWERWERGGQILKQKEAERKAAKATPQAPQTPAAVQSQVAAPPQTAAPPRKPAASAPQAPKERKSTAHLASGG